MSEHAHDHDELEDHDLGLSHDLPQIVAKERALGAARAARADGRRRGGGAGRLR